MSTSPISVTLADKTIEKIDKSRGLSKRSTFIDSILSNYLDNSEGKNPSVKDTKMTKSKGSKI